MEKTRIISISFLVLSLFLAGFLGNSIYKSIDDADRIATMERQIIDKLIMIREAQIAYQAVNGQYTSDWDKLKSFVDSGQFFLTSKIEHIITLDYGADSVYVEIDTLGTVAVKDSLFSADKYPNFDLVTMSIVPGTTDKEFAMWADKIEKSNVRVDVVEVWNTAPVDPKRKEDNEARTKKPLRFGSRTSITTAGNWE
ncbi:hypothetical protein N7E81_12095 [Reichenbachiella carrageenanivorans]|uniref:Uncharacterized protein n=1 Tax=Reichenbachiella carrageenanivorans TaxID=2979869 RepID=A0ABY6CWL3_9BACT|nr:hypothetical protein [Reichenbachiella carrageenanivorans]UXX78099.1 hypothetical protein N7E81_12095 [Reichenbachiella carrageenanivorans]